MEPVSMYIFEMGQNWDCFPKIKPKGHSMDCSSVNYKSIKFNKYNNEYGFKFIIKEAWIFKSLQC